MFSIERFAGAYALCEDGDGRRVKLLRSALPADAREGDLILWEGAWRIDGTATAARRAQLEKRTAGLKKPEKLV